MSDSPEWGWIFMNWSKILNIFIAIFLVINLVLYGVTVHQGRVEYNLSQERADMLRTILEAHSYAIYDHLPAFYPMAELKLNLPQRNKEAIVQAIFADESVETSFAANLEKYRSDTQQVTFYKGREKGLVAYSSEAPTYALKKFVQSEVEALGETFARHMMPDVDRLELTYVKAYNDYYILEFNEIYKGQILFCSYVNMRISRAGVTSAQSMRCQPAGFEGKDMEIVPIDEVLYNFMSQVKPGKDEFYSIKKIDLGYHLAQSPMEGETTLQGVPYYRIKLDDESVYYMNALTNALKEER